jgi:hypothetical protein
MIKYTYKVDKLKVSLKNETFFDISIKIYIQNIFFVFFLFIKFNIHLLQFLKNLDSKSKYVLLKLNGQNGVQMYFFIIKLNKINMY